MSTRLAFIAPLALLAVAGCSAAVEPGDADSTESELGTSAPGTYVVPAADPSAGSAATFPVTVKVQALPSGLVRMHYTLPAELVGVPQDVNLVGPTQGALAGPAGSATCTQDGSQTTCNERLHGVQVDLDAVAANLQAQGLQGDQLAVRMGVAERFGIDPIGVLKFSPRRVRGNRSHD